MSVAMTTEKFDIASRRAGVRRTVWILSFVALAIFVGFCLDQMVR
jgi:preprotein translocase subunit SecE